MKKLIKGQSLFEVVVSLAIISIVIIALIYLSSNTISNTTYSKTKTQAAKKAQEATEWLRSERDTDWDTFYLKASPPGKYCLQSLNWGNIGTCVPGEYVPNSILRRNLTLSQILVNGKDAVRADISVFWEDTEGSHQTRVVTDFTDWR